MLSHRTRMELCLSGEKPDRVPVALWRHFPVDDQTPEGLALASLNFQRIFDFDFLKISPASSFCIKDWGAEDEWRGASEGTRDYTNRVIESPEDWINLTVLDPDKGYLGAQISCLRMLFNELGTDSPIVQTVFSPLSQAKNLVGKEKLIAHLRQYPDALHTGLKTIAETTRQFIESIQLTGAAGVFYAVQHAQYGMLTEQEYRIFGKEYDLMVLEPAKEMWLNILHIHGQDIIFDIFNDYPVQILNWHDRETFPSLREGQQRFQGTVCGGLQREKSLVLGTPEMIIGEAKEAIESTQGVRFILGTGCVVPTTAPFGNIMAARNSVE